MASPILHDREFLRRVAVTAAALAVYRLGCQIPLPGLDPHTLADVSASSGLATERVSIFALGIWPLITVMILVEIAKTLFPSLRRWELAEPRHSARLSGIIIALALAMTAMQAFGYAGALADVATLVEQPGAWFRISCVVTLVAALALLIGLARVIDRDGIGHGVWLLFLASVLSDVPKRVLAIYDLYLQNNYPLWAILLGCAVVVAAVAALSAPPAYGPC
jgi:preprotein translocase subunit SecY